MLAPTTGEDNGHTARQS